MSLELNKIHQMDCLDGMKQLDDESIDLVATDPPYFLINKSGSGFMGKQCDSFNKKKRGKKKCVRHSAE